MSEFLKMDVFFMVTTAAIVVITTLLSVLFLRIYNILRDIERISKNVSAESVLLRNDIADVRAVLRGEGYKIQILLSSIHAFLQKFFSRRRTERHSKA